MDCACYRTCTASNLIFVKLHYPYAALIRECLRGAVTFRMNGEAISLGQQRELVAKCKAKVQPHFVSFRLLSHPFSP